MWVPPHAELDFTIVKKSELPPSNVLRPAQWWNTVPVWAQAAAAMLVLAAGAAIANLQVKSGPDGFSVSTGWMAPAASRRARRSTARPSNERVEDGAGVARTAAAQRDPLDARDQPRRSPRAGRSDEAIVRRVQQLIADAEQRQQRELATRLIDFTRDINMQRRADMQSIGARRRFV